MSEHKVTESILNAGLQRSALISCSCGLFIDVANIRKLPLSVARRQLAGMHENLVPENSPEPKKKKSKKYQPVVETEPVKDKEPEQEPNEDWPDEDWDKS